MYLNNINKKSLSAFFTPFLDPHRTVPISAPFPLTAHVRPRRGRAAGGPVSRTKKNSITMHCRALSLQPWSLWSCLCRVVLSTYMHSYSPTRAPCSHTCTSILLQSERRRLEIIPSFVGFTYKILHPSATNDPTQTHSLPHQFY